MPISKQIATTAKEDVQDPMLLAVKFYTEHLEAGHPCYMSSISLTQVSSFMGNYPVGLLIAGFLLSYSSMPNVGNLYMSLRR